ncbi:MAG: hypothetical protein ACHP6I_03935 [Rickettsiales bacterium]
MLLFKINNTTNFSYNSQRLEHLCIDRIEFLVDPRVLQNNNPPISAIFDARMCIDDQYLILSDCQKKNFAIISSLYKCYYDLYTSCKYQALVNHLLSYFFDSYRNPPSICDDTMFVIEYTDTANVDFGRCADYALQINPEIHDGCAINIKLTNDYI